MPGVPDLRRLGTDPTYPEAKARPVGGIKHGRQFGVDTERYGKPYVFARIHDAAVWVVWAGPFVDDAAAVAWIEGL